MCDDDDDGYDGVGDVLEKDGHRDYDEPNPNPNISDDYESDHPMVMI